MKKKKETNNLGELKEALKLLEQEKGISSDFIYEALETALTRAYKNNYKDDHDNIRIDVNKETGEIKVIAHRIVVENIGDLAEYNEMTVEDARKIKADVKHGDEIDVEILPKDFGRIAAQTAKQIILQKIREAEREHILKEFDIKAGDIISGTVDRIEKIEPRPREGEPAADTKTRYNIVFNIGKTDVVLGSKGQVPGESYRHGEKMLLYVVEIANTPKGPFVHVSRSHQDFVTKLFTREVPEIQEGVVEIKSVSREAGVRSKIAVWSNDENVEPVGSCVGGNGSRVNAVVDSLGGEKVDIVKYSDDPEEFIGAAIAPAQAKRVMIDYTDVERGKKEALVLVDESQLSLAIGKSGLNAKLAARLTGWKIDIKSESTYLQDILGSDFKTNSLEDLPDIPASPSFDELLSNLNLPDNE